jgi:dTDP-4-dehydrorhamnose reductase
MKYLIAGRQGQLGRAFIKKFEELSVDFYAPEEFLFDIRDFAAVAGCVDSYRPDVIINCAAYNLVDKAELEQDAAFAVNTAGPRNLARAAAKQKAMLVHFGTDYVFDGTKENDLYVESDAAEPVNVYGKSKLAGEHEVHEELDRFLILRLSWVFGDGQQNFIYKVREWSKNSSSLKITCDEFSVPTYAETVVDASLKALDRGITGLFHLTNTGFCSRYEWAKLILTQLGENTFVRPVTLDSFKLPARRPLFSAMSNRKIAGLLGMDIISWEEAVKSFLKKF